jgi:hypothetical protein
VLHAADRANPPPRSSHTCCMQQTEPIHLQGAAIRVACSRQSQSTSNEQPYVLHAAASLHRSWLHPTPDQLHQVNSSKHRAGPYPYCPHLHHATPAF